MSTPTIEIVEWKPVSKGSLRGFATVRLRNGLSIADVTVHTSHGKAWASFPSKPMLDRDGVQKKDQTTGKPKWVPILSWPDRDTSDRFSAAVIAALEAAHPGAVAE